jgi:two-component system chemotaxis sensor kinase CheA
MGASVEARGATRMSALVLEDAGKRVAVSVDRVWGMAHVVMRALPAAAAVDKIVAGASLDAAGAPQAILDPAGLVAAVLAAPRMSAAVAGRVAKPLLVIDDSMTTRMLEQSILESAGYRVEVASSAEEGLDKARRGDFGAFLVDVEMPGMDGFGFLEQVRADIALRHIPGILVTSRNEPEDRLRAEQVGARAYVVKSEFDQAQLLATIARLVAA